MLAFRQSDPLVEVGGGLVKSPRSRWISPSIDRANACRRGCPAAGDNPTASTSRAMARG